MTARANCKLRIAVPPDAGATRPRVVMGSVPKFQRDYRSSLLDTL